MISQCYQRHRHQELLKFLRTLDNEFPGQVPLHLVMEYYGPHKHEHVRNWLKRHPRFLLHFVPTSSSWLNLVERWFSHLDGKAIRRGVLPFVWTATVQSISKKPSRLRQTLELIQSGCTRPPVRKRQKWVQLFRGQYTLTRLRLRPTRCIS